MSQRKLEEIIKYLTGHNYPGVWYKSDEEARSAILELFRDAVPQEIHLKCVNDDKDEKEFMGRGWNQCRTETLRNFEKL